MKISNLYKYYSFGFNYHPLLRGDLTIFTNKELLDRLTNYKTFIEELNLIVTKSGMDLNKLNDDYEELNTIVKSSPTKQVLTKNSDSISQKISKIDSILDAELRITSGYLLDEKRFSNEHLTSDIGKLFASGVFNSLPTIASYDFKECGLCIVFDRFTAAAFHALRGTEDTLKLYYTKILNKIPSDEATWGTFVTEINDAIKNSLINPVPSEAILADLNSLRKYYRNPTQHPELIYFADDSQDLFSACIKMVNDLILDLKKRSLIS